MSISYSRQISPECTVKVNRFIAPTIGLEFFIYRARIPDVEIYERNCTGYLSGLIFMKGMILRRCNRGGIAWEENLPLK